MSRCAAATLAENLIALREPLGPVRLWALVDEARTTAERAVNGGTHPETSTFWRAIETELAEDPPIAMDTSGVWSPASDLLHTRTELEIAEVSALRKVGVDLTHSCLAGYSNVLSKAGTSPLDARSLGDALEGAHVLEELRCGVGVSGGQRRSIIEPLWRTVERILVPDGSSNRRLLARAPLFLSYDHRLVTFEEGRRRPEKVSLERLAKWFPSLSLPHPRLEEYRVALLLSEELEPERVLYVLKEAWPPGGSTSRFSDSKSNDLRAFFRLIRDLMVGLDREADSKTLSELALLPIFRAGGGFVSAQGSMLPGDFDDPIGVASLLDKDCYDPVTQEFLREHLGVRDQSIEAYVSSQLPVFFANSPPVEEYKRLLTVLANHPDLLGSSGLVEALGELRMIPTKDGEWDMPNRTYKHSRELEELMGFGPAWWLDETRIPMTRRTVEFLVDLGVREVPCAEHLLLAMEQLTESEPLEIVQKQSEQFFYAICDSFQLWTEKDGVDLERLEDYQSEAIFPAEGIYDEWFSGNELYAPYRSAAFASQANVLPFRTMQRLNRDVLEFFEVNTEPTTEMVISHLRHCVEERIAVSPLAYQILNERANEEGHGEQIAKLKDEPCIWNESGRTYLRPSRLFWSDPRLGRFGTRVPSRTDDYRRFLNVVGVAERPTSRNYLDIVRQIAGEYGEGRPLSEDDGAVMRSCLRGIAGALTDQDEEIRKEVSSLHDCPCIVTLARKSHQGGRHGIRIHVKGNGIKTLPRTKERIPCTHSVIRPI